MTASCGGITSGAGESEGGEANTGLGGASVGLGGAGGSAAAANGGAAAGAPGSGGTGFVQGGSSATSSTTGGLQRETPASGGAGTELGSGGATTTVPAAACEREQGEALVTCCNALLDPFVPEGRLVADVEAARAVPEILSCCGAVAKLSQAPGDWGALMNCCYVMGHPPGVCSPWGPPMPPEFELPTWLRGESNAELGFEAGGYVA